jgi:DNA helicase-2/ATP-dependent DNA helicase PcrA
MYTDAIEEANAVAREIKLLLDSGYEPDDVFIGARTRAQTGFLEGPLTQQDIPYINLVGTSFFGQKHVKDVIAYMKLAYDQSDSEAFQRVFNVASSNMVYPWGKNKGEYCSHRFLGKKFLRACFDGETGQPQFKWIWKAVKSRRSYRPGVQDLEWMVNRIKDVLGFEPLPFVIQFILDHCYLDYLQKEEGLTESDPGQNGKVDDFETLKEIAAKFDSAKDFFDYVDNAERAAKKAKEGDWSDHVVISTIHRLKGQERKVVFGIGFGEGGDKQGNPCGLLPHTYSMRPPQSRGVLPTGGQSRMEDERDIAFVLVSRAKELVYLSTPEIYHNQGLYPSRFVHEMGLLERGQEQWG